MATETPNALLKIIFFKNFICCIFKLLKSQMKLVINKNDAFHSKIFQSYLLDAKSIKRLRHKIVKIKRSRILA